MRVTLLQGLSLARSLKLIMTAAGNRNRRTGRNPIIPRIGSKDNAEILGGEGKNSLIKVRLLTNPLMENTKGLYNQTTSIMIVRIHADLRIRDSGSLHENEILADVFQKCVAANANVNILIPIPVEGIGKEANITGRVVDQVGVADVTHTKTVSKKEDLTVNNPSGPRKIKNNADLQTARETDTNKK